MSNTNVTPPTNTANMPSNVPKGWATWIAAVAGVAAFGILPALHQWFPVIPALDVNSVTAGLGILISFAIWFHAAGLKGVLSAFQTNLLPMLIKDLTPVLQAEMEKIVKSELDKQTQVLNASRNAAIEKQTQEITANLSK